MNARFTLPLILSTLAAFAQSGSAEGRVMQQFHVSPAGNDANRVHRKSPLPPFSAHATRSGRSTRRLAATSSSCWAARIRCGDAPLPSRATRRPAATRSCIARRPRARRGRQWQDRRRLAAGRRGDAGRPPRIWPTSRRLYVDGESAPCGPKATRTPDAGFTARTATRPAPRPWRTGRTRATSNSALPWSGATPSARSAHRAWSDRAVVEDGDPLFPTPARRGRPGGQAHVRRERPRAPRRARRVVSGPGLQDRLLQTLARTGHGKGSRRRPCRRDAGGVRGDVDRPVAGLRSRGSSSPGRVAPAERNRTRRCARRTSR